MDRYTTESQAVNVAKQQLRTAARQTDHLAPIKNHPVASISAAFMAGILWQKFDKRQLPPGLLSVGLQLLKKL